MSDATKEPGSPWRMEPHRLRLALQASGGVFYDWDMLSDHIIWSDGAAAALGIGAAEQIATGAGFRMKIGPDDWPLRALALAKHLDEGQPFDCTYKLRRQDGRFEWAHERGVAERTPHGAPERLVGIIHLVTETRTRQERLERLARHDDLTGHLNKSGFREQLDVMLAARPSGGGYPSLLVVNIDNLGAVNEAHGYEVGDGIIVEIGRRMRRLLHAGDRLGRVAGNQYGILLEADTGPGMTVTAERLLRAVRERVVTTVAGPIAVSVSIGGVTLSADTVSFQAALGRAEEALGRAKRAGRDRFVGYDLRPEKAARRGATLAAGDQVLRALNEDRLKLAFQPIVDAESGRPAMYECLLRMRDQAGNVVPAGMFMPAVEGLGLVRLIDRRVLELALRELADHAGVRLAINVSSVSAADRAAMAELVALVEAHRSFADRLTFEITETVAIKDFEESARSVALLKELGCSVAVDDFGAGYTSFRHLKALAVDMVKIDGQFVQGLGRDRDNQLFVDTLLKLAQGLGLRTVAECVETHVDAQALSERGVNLLQGYFFGRPVLDPPWRVKATGGRRSGTAGRV